MPQISNLCPPMVAIIGAPYAVSYGRPPGFATHTISPVLLFIAMKRCARFAMVPQLEMGELTITRSPSINGDMVRPPWVVNAPNSSPTERSHNFLPSFDKATTVAATPKAYTFPVSGSTAGDAQPTRCAGASL